MESVIEPSPRNPLGVLVRPNVAIVSPPGTMFSPEVSIDKDEINFEAMDMPRGGCWKAR